MSGISKTIERLRELHPKASIHVKYIMPIITAYEESQKANAELLAALKPFANFKTNLEEDEYDYLGDLSGNKITAGDLRDAHKVYDKHKGE